MSEEFEGFYVRGFTHAECVEAMDRAGITEEDYAAVYAKAVEAERGYALKPPSVLWFTVTDGVLTASWAARFAP